MKRNPVTKDGIKSSELPFSGKGTKTMGPKKSGSVAGSAQLEKFVSGLKKGSSSNKSATPKVTKSKGTTSGRSKKMGY